MSLAVCLHFTLTLPLKPCWIDYKYIMVCCLLNELMICTLCVCVWGGGGGGGGVLFIQALWGGAYFWKIYYCDHPLLPPYMNEKSFWKFWVICMCMNHRWNCKLHTHKSGVIGTLQHLVYLQTGPEHAYLLSRYTFLYTHSTFQFILRVELHK